MEQNYPDIDLFEIFDAEIEDGIELEKEEIIKNQIGHLYMWYCSECGYFNYKGFDDNICPNCYNKIKYPILNLIDWGDDKNIEHLSTFTSKCHLDSPNLRTIISAISNAKYFIHIATESLDRFFAGMLTIKAEQGCDVKAVFWRQKDNHLKKLVEQNWEMSNKIRRYHGTHQKLIIIDGIVAFKGSANATFDGWTRYSEMRETDTNLSKIKILNEEYFAHWYKLGKTLN